MDPLSMVLFLLVVFIGSYVQSVAGFAMGMIIVAVAGGFRLLDIPTLAAVISLTTILNVGIALKGHTHEIHRKLFAGVAIGQVPAIFAGFALMTWLDASARLVLELCLGVFITIGGLSMFLRPQPWPAVSGTGTAICVGVTGGLVGGMFSASGPVLGWFGYSQPLSVAVIRATLLACFVLTTVTRTVIVGVDGGLTGQVLGIAALSLPVVVLGTWLGKAFAPPLSEAQMKRCAYLLLLSMGLWILASTLWGSV